MNADEHVAQQLTVRALEWLAQHVACRDRGPDPGLTWVCRRDGKTDLLCRGCGQVLVDVGQTAA